MKMDCSQSFSLSPFRFFPYPPPVTMVLLIYLLIPAAFAIGLYAVGVRSKKVLAASFSGFILVPVLLVAGLYLFRTPIQQGRVLPGLGPVLSLLFPAPDLYVPLAVVPLEPGKTEYGLAWTHRYVGRHALAVSVPGKSGSLAPLEPKLTVDMKVFADGDLIFEGTSDRAGGYWARDHYGLHLVWYRVPGDLPVGRPLTGVITVAGDLTGFLKNYPDTSLRVVKVSDE